MTICGVCFESRKLALCTMWDPVFKQVRVFTHNPDIKVVSSSEREAVDEVDALLTPRVPGTLISEAKPVPSRGQRIKAPQNHISISERTEKPGALHQQAQEAMMKTPHAMDKDLQNGWIFSPPIPSIEVPKPEVHVNDPLLLKTLQSLEAIASALKTDREHSDAKFNSLQRQIGSLATHQASQSRLLQAKDDSGRDNLGTFSTEVAVSSPILTSNGRVIGGLSITSSTDIHSLESLEKYKPELLATSEQIGKEAGVWSFPEKSIN